MNPQTPDQSGPQMQPPVQPAQPSLPAAPVPVASQPQTVPAAAAVPVPNAPSSADDGDVIEPEWIHRAEQVIRENATDPYQLAAKLNAMKADYLQKRYAKDIKVASD